MTEPDDGWPSRRAASADQQFWNLWRHGRRPDLGAFLAERPGLSAEAVAAVVAIDQYERWLGGERVQAEEYLALLPAEGRDQAACDIVYGEYLLREQLGEHPALDEYQLRFPTLAGLLARQVDLHRALAEEPAASTGGPAPRVLPTVHTAGGGKPVCFPDVPGYEVLDEIGRGGMGVVYRARQLSLDREVALKVVRVRSDGDPQALERMRREARITAQLSHPHVVTVHNAELFGDLFYVAMEYVRGIDLHRLVEKSGPLPVPRACDYIRQAALGLAAAHEHNIIHRDVKPSNLIVTRHEGGDVVKLLDLGLARQELPAGAAGLTQAGAFMGTPDFVAPEQANDPRNADARSDLYSLGGTFYFVLTGQPPFDGPTPMKKLLQHHTSEPLAVERLRPEVPAAVAAIVRRLLAKPPEARFQSAAELARALAAVVHSDDSGLAPPRPSEVAASRRLATHDDWVKGVAFAPDGRWLASVSLDRTVRLWDTQSGAELWRGAGHDAGVLCLAFSPDGAALATAGQDRQVVLWDLAGRRVRWRAEGHADNVNAVAFTPDGRHVLSGSHDGTLRLWDAVRGQQVLSWTGHAGPVWGVALTPDGRAALSGGQDRHLRLWDLRTGESLAASAEQPTPVSAVAVSPDGRLALSGGGVDGVLRVWGLPGPRELRRIEGHEGRVNTAAFAADGRRAASGSRDRTVRVWEVETGRPLAVLTGHGHWVSCVAWSPGGDQVASGSGDGAVWLWRAPA